MRNGSTGTPPSPTPSTNSAAVSRTLLPGALPVCDAGAGPAAEHHGDAIGERDGPGLPQQLAEHRPAAAAGSTGDWRPFPLPLRVHFRFRRSAALSWGSAAVAQRPLVAGGGNAPRGGRWVLQGWEKGGLGGRMGGV